jgi:hypothetical protein
VAIFYLVIDHGLPETLERFIRGRKSLDQHQQVLKAHKKLLNLFILLFVVRLFATGLSSIWAGGEIGDMTTDDFNGDKYIASAALRDSTDNAKLSTATTELKELRNTEGQRVAAAEAKGKREIAAAVKTGNPSQQAMWKKNPGYFNPPPRGQYYPQNKAFADRVHAAQANAERYVQEELGKTSGAQALLYNVSADTTSGQYLASLGSAADYERTKLEQTEGRRKNLVVISDVLAIIFGLFARGIKINLEEVTGQRNSPKNFSYIIAEAMENFRVWILELLESLLGVDLDGNGTVGTATNRMQQSNQIGFQMNGRNNTNASYEEPTPTPRRPIGFFSPSSPAPDTSTPDVSQWPPVATDTDYTKVEPSVLMLAYKEAKSNMKKWEAKQNNGQGTTETNNRNIAKWQKKMEVIESRLREIQ